MLEWVFAALLAWVLACASVALAFAPVLRRLWREPVFRVPVLVFESDDWGAGPLVQAQGLERLCEVLARHRDAGGHPAVASLALVLAVPDGPAIAATGRYARLRLDAAVLRPVLEALRRGRAEGLLAWQLHGLEHYWPAALMASADPAVQAWCRAPQPALTEALPSALQSRWVNAATLPARPHPDAEVAAAVADEVATYRELLGETPRIAVPPTFVWSEAVEREWARHGVAWLVTPGWRCTTRGAQGEAGGAEGAWFNGQRVGGLRRLVRTGYFEPKKGRDAARALATLAEDRAQGRPSVLENHRDNFLQDEERSAHAWRELDALLAGALQRWPELRFLSTAELCAVIERADRDWLLGGWRERLPFYLQRLRRVRRLGKLMRWSGVAALGAVLAAVLTAPEHAKLRGEAGRA